MNRTKPPAQHESKYDRDDDYGPNEDGNVQFEQGQLRPAGVASDEIDPGELPVDPDEGPVPMGIPRNPEHERVPSPDESWDPQRTQTLLVPPFRMSQQFVRCS